MRSRRPVSHIGARLSAVLEILDRQRRALPLASGHERMLPFVRKDLMIE